jgi:hypothetical protein
MKGSGKWLLVAVAVALAAAVVAVWLARASRARKLAEVPRAVTGGGTGSVSAAAWSPGPARYEGAPEPEGIVERLLSPAPEVPPTQTLTGEVVRVEPATILASVNGVGITLRDLMPVSRQAPAGRSVQPEMLEFLLDRAIARELTFQAARQRGVGLTEAQQGQLEAIRGRAMERDPASFSDVHDDFEAKAEFEVRDFAGLMLQEQVLEAAGGPPRHVTPELVRAYYEQHRAELGELPAEPEKQAEAWQAMETEIRIKMAAEVDAAHQAALQKMIEELKANANINRYLRTGA